MISSHFSNSIIFFYGNSEEIQKLSNISTTEKTSQKNETKTTVKNGSKKKNWFEWQLKVRKIRIESVDHTKKSIMFPQNNHDYNDDGWWWIKYAKIDDHHW